MTDRFGLNKAIVQTHNGSFMDTKTAFTNRLRP